MVPQSWICSTLTECRYRDILSLFAPSVRYPDSLHFVRPQIRCLGFAPRYVGSDFSPFGLCILTTTLSGLITLRPSANPPSENSHFGSKIQIKKHLSGVFLFEWYPQANSNRCRLREREVS